MSKLNELESFEEVAEKLSVPYMSYNYGSVRPQSNFTIILANPRSGSSLLSRLLNVACLTKCRGDKPVDLFQSLIVMTEAMKQGTYFCDAMQGKGEHDMFNGEYNQESRDRNIMRMWSLALFNDPVISSGMLKSTLLGFGNDLVIPFLKSLEESMKSINFNLVILKRDPEEVVDSLVNSKRDGGINPNQRDAALNLVHKQNEQFKEAADFDTTFITYSQLVSDPIGTLVKLPISVEPDERLVIKIMKKKMP